MKAYFDLDGVLRDLVSIVWGGKEPEHYNTTNREGKNLIEIINENMEILVEAPPTPFIEVAREYKPLILTNQLDAWKPYTIKWIKKYLPSCPVIFSTPIEKLQLIEHNKSYLVEDYPFFKDYSRIILIDRTYNREVEKPYARVRTVEELWKYLQ